MSNDTNAPEIQQFNIDGLTTDFAVEVRKARGSDARVTSYVARPAGSIIDWLKHLAGGSAEKVKAVIIRDIIKPMCHEASSDAFDPATDTFSEAKFVEALRQYLEPASRRTGGASKRDLVDRLSAIAPELTALIGKALANGGKLDDETESNRFQQLFLEQKELAAKLEQKERGAGERKSKKAAKAAAAAAGFAEPAAS